MIIENRQAGSDHDDGEYGKRFEPFAAGVFEGRERAVGAPGEEGPAAGFGGGDVCSADAFGGKRLAREEEAGLAEGGEEEA